jgi:hypothetical protein
MGRKVKIIALSNGKYEPSNQLFVEQQVVLQT